MILRALFSHVTFQMQQKRKPQTGPRQAFAAHKAKKSFSGEKYGTEVLV